ncbi:MAG TPA: vWA domain-containing protein [Bryobacteraceae bacterium]|jgi:Flp pilus assembly protein TadG|nr:vWA domain-containing protein [Bryobacteraceae bacterium]
MNGNKPKTLNERGISLIFTAMTLVFIVPMVGLAIDAGILYTVKGKLQMAVDAASLAAARALSRGNDDTSQQSNAKAVAEEYVLLNFPSGYFNVSTPTFGQNNSGVSVDESVANQRSVSVTAYVTAPLYFLRWLGSTNTTVSATATAVRRDVNVAIVMDRSGSLTLSNSCTPLKAAAVAFVSKFANGRDNVGLVTFATSTLLPNGDFAMANDFQTANPSVPTILNSIICTGGTNTAQALNQGYQQLVGLNQPNALNVVLLFTDGYPNTFTATFPIKASSSCTNKNPKIGVMAATYNNGQPTIPVGEVGLLYWIATTQPMASDVTLGPPAAQGGDAGCTYAGSMGSVASDVQYIPTTDMWGNNMNTGYQSVTMNGSNINIDPYSVQNAGWNAADSAALRIRQSNVLPNIRVFAIGLGNAASGVPTDFLERAANDPRASNYDSTYPTGLYVFAPQASDLGEAFAQVASEILHLAR